MTGFLVQLRLLLWKNLTLYRRRPCALVFEIGVPIFFAVLMLIIRTLIERDINDTSTHYTAQDLHMASFYPTNLQIGYVPDYANTESVMTDVITNFNTFSGTSATKVGFDSESALETYYTANTDTLRLAVVFYGVSNSSTLPTAVSYRIRPATNDSQRWYTERNYPFFQSNSPRDISDGPAYYDSGAACLLSLVGESILRKWYGWEYSFPSYEMFAQRMPYPPYYEDNMIAVLQGNLPLFLMLSFMLTVIMTTKSIVLEKERRIKESMKLMGLRPAAHWASWFLTTFIYLALATAVYAILFGVEVNDAVGAVLSNSDISLFYVFLLCYSLALVTFCFMISVLIQKANVAAAVAGIVFYGLYFPYQFVQNDYESMSHESMSQGSKLGLCFFFNMAMAFGSNVIGLTEGTGSGARWDNVGQTATVDDNFTLLSAMGMLLLDSGLHLLITWYVDNVFPGEFGVARPFYFCFTRSYWCGGKSRRDAGYDSSQTDEQHFEKEPSDLTPGIQICNLTKLKGGKRSGVKAEVAEMVKEVGLEGKARTHAANLSGGQKRKLSVGIALIAGSKVVILDEPTSGMDPAARRQTWELLQRYRATRTVLLTTHYMDEADVLGDRIAIMAQGVVKCCGSSLFLKKLFGTGYHLVCVKEDWCSVPALTDAVQSHISGARFESEVNVELSYLLPDDQSSFFPDLFRFLEARKLDLGIMSFGTSATTMEEVFLKVGEQAEEEPSSPSKAGVVVANGSSPRIASRDGFTNKVMTVEERNSCTPSATPRPADQQPEKPAQDILAFNRKYVKLAGWRLWWSRFYGMFVKKVILSWRHRAISVTQLLLPVVFTALALLIDFQVVKSESPLTFNLALFDTTYVAYSDGRVPSSASHSAAEMYATYMTGQSLVKVNDTYANMSTYLLTLATSLGTSTYNKEVIVGAQFEQIYSPRRSLLKMTAYYNGQHYHAMPIAITLVLNGLAQNLFGSRYSLNVSTNPLPKDADAEAEDSSTNSSTQGFLVGFCISFGMAFLVSSFVYFLVKEREVGAKHMQVVSGVGPGMFWVATLAWDYLNYLIPAFAMLVVFAAFQTNAYIEDNRLGLVLLVLLLYGWAALAFVYLVSFLFRSPSTSMVILIVFNVFTGLVTTITVYILQLPSLGLEETADILNWIFMALFPNYCMAKSFMDMSTNYDTIDACTKLSYTTTCPVKAGPCCKSYGNCMSSCLDFETNYAAWSSPGIGRFLFFMFLQGVVFMSVVLALELSLFSTIRAMCKGSKGTSKDGDVNATPLYYINGVALGTGEDVEDSDVANERKRILGQGKEQNDPLVLANLTKKYGHFTAVDQICVGVPEEECFGLLGQNGAGKTTTFKMLTGDVSVTDGNAFLKGSDVVRDLKQVQQNMGYCPQFDALLDTMTGRETLWMYARLRGVPAPHIEDVVDHLVDILMLQPHKDKLVGHYSGGNKRKLSTAIALVGDPPFLLLDDPSSGVDPAARRQLWTVLSQVRASGRTLVLTSHSMEECDALCTRIAIMVNGQFKCLGSPQHLKNKFGHGYTLVVKMGLAPDGFLAPRQPVVDTVLNDFKGSNVFVDMDGYVHFQVPHEAAHMADMFSLMEKAKRELFVEDYSVHQTTLEQVFLSFTRKQAPPKENVNYSVLEKICCCCCCHRISGTQNRVGNS